MLRPRERSSEGQATLYFTVNVSACRTPEGISEQQTDPVFCISWCNVVSASAAAKSPRAQVDHCFRNELGWGKTNFAALANADLDACEVGVTFYPAPADEVLPPETGRACRMVFGIDRIVHRIRRLLTEGSRVYYTTFWI